MSLAGLTPVTTGLEQRRAITRDTTRALGAQPLLITSLLTHTERSGGRFTNILASKGRNISIASETHKVQ